MTYRVNDWGSGFTAEVTITNRSSSPINGWTLQWTFGGNQRITNHWNSTITQSGQQVTASNAAWNGTIGANGGTASFGFQGSYSGANPLPTAFTLNGTACTAG
ncbi:hypothetical protein GCM10010116_43640 [Microbispora rosea subsp. aerata]|nr:cellulose binding domain-containing protein [Microbispora rosea]GGO21682.1 hypothetical protein GCM10010116_43640 [Microbispora rosea subsp. aerata]